MRPGRSRTWRRPPSGCIPSATTASSPETTGRAVKQIDAILRQRHHIDEDRDPDFEIHTQKEFAETPIYKVLDEKGPDHSKCFKIAALIGRYHYAAAWGRNKKEAEKKAAMNAIAQINGDEIPYLVD